jgi:hypothetical protein
MTRSLLTSSADAAVPAAATGLLTNDSGVVLATPLAVIGAVAGGIAAATGVGSLATAGIAAVQKGDEEEPAPPPEDALGDGGHVSALLARRGAASVR